MRFCRTHYWLVAVALLFSMGCATRLSRPKTDDARIDAERREQLKLALNLMLDRQTYVWGIGSRLRRAGAEFCGEDVRYTFGFFAVDPATFAKDYQEVAHAIGLASGVRIWKTLPDFQPAGAQLQKGDKIVEINAEPISDYKSFEEAMGKPFETGQLLMKVMRASGEEAEVSMKGSLACDYRAAVVEKDVVNAMADGKNVILTTGMLRFTETDDEIAIVLGHEFAHNALGHMRQMRAQVLAGMLADLAVAVFSGVSTGVFSNLARIAFSEEFEADADYLGLYFVARAGYDFHLAPQFWRRMAVEHTKNIRDSMVSTHPSTPERAVVLKKTIEEIDEKMKKGAALVPAKQDKLPSIEHKESIGGFKNNEEEKY
jgi:hypothetical protein